MERILFNLKLNLKEVKSFIYFNYRFFLINQTYKTKLKSFKLRLTWI